MIALRSLTSLTAAAVVITSIGLTATPAEARHRHGGWGHRHHDRVDAGDVIGGLLVIGSIAAIASSVSKDKRKRGDRYEPPYRRDRDNRDDWQYDRDDRRDRDDEARSDGSRSDSETRAADACGWAVESDLGDDARIERVDRPTPSGSGWYVTGTASNASGDLRSFGCTYSGGRVTDVRFG